MFGSRRGGGEWARGLGFTSYVGKSGLGAWDRVWEGGVVLCMCVVSLDYLCRWQVQVYVYCARRRPAHLGYTQY